MVCGITSSKRAFMNLAAMAAPTANVCPWPSGPEVLDVYKRQGDVLVVCNTAVLVHLQEKVVVDCLYLVFLADIATEPVSYTHLDVYKRQDIRRGC